MISTVSVQGRSLAGHLARTMRASLSIRASRIEVHVYVPGREAASARRRIHARLVSDLRAGIRMGRI
jgi:hypothetical protein